MKVNGYCLLIFGTIPAYRIVFKSSLSGAIKIIPDLKRESGGRIEILRMVDSDTKLIKEENSDVNIED